MYLVTFKTTGTIFGPKQTVSFLKADCVGSSGTLRNQVASQFSSKWGHTPQTSCSGGGTRLHTCEVKTHLLLLFITLRPSYSTQAALDTTHSENKSKKGAKSYLLPFLFDIF